MIGNNDIDLGWILPPVALIMNFIMSQEINQWLTIMVSGASLIYLGMKIEEKYYLMKTRNKKSDGEDKKHKEG